MGGWWEPAAALTCTSLFTASGVSQKPGDIFKISEIELQKGRAGLLPRPGTLPSSAPSFLWDSFAHVYAATHARPPAHSSVRVSRLIAARICSSPCRSANATAASLIRAISRRMRHSPTPLNSGCRITSRCDNSPPIFTASSFTASLSVAL